MEPEGYDRKITMMVINPLPSRVYVLDPIETLEDNSKKLLISNVNGFNFLEEFTQVEFDLK